MMSPGSSSSWEIASVIPFPASGWRVVVVNPVELSRGRAPHAIETKAEQSMRHFLCGSGPRLVVFIE